MRKLISAVLAAAFAVATVSPVAFAQEKEKKAPASKASKAAAVEAACKDMKPGDVVKVEGKDVKCPAPKKSAPK